jgi:glycosyltransferase involved in cell wall biosynthesis
MAGAQLRPAYRGAVYLVADHPWPPTSGGRSRDASRAEALQRLGPVLVLSLDMPDAPPQWAAAQRRYWARRRRQALRVLDLAAGIARANHVALQRAIAAEMPAAMRDVLRDTKPSVVILGRPFFGEFIRVARATGACVIVDADESIAAVSLSMLRSRAPLGARLRALADMLSAGRMERRDFPMADEIWAGSQIEAAVLKSESAPSSVRIVPNIAPIGLAYADPGPIRQVAFVGSYSHPPNEEAAIELVTRIMPAVRAAGGPSELLLIGRGPTPRLRRIASAGLGVRIVADVADVSVTLRSAGVLVMPIRSGGGSRIKALEAAALGVPIISTAFGISGSGLRPGVDVLVAETPEEFANALRILQDDAGFRTSLALSASKSIARHHSLDVLAETVAAAVQSCGAQPGGVAS